MSKNHLLSILIIAILINACTKEPEIAPVSTSPVTTPAAANSAETRSQLSLDSIFLYAKEIYYWSDALPAYEVFNPRKYTTGSDLTKYKSELFDITQYKINPLTGKPYEFVANASNLNAGYPKYSFIDDKTTNNPIAYIPDLQGSVDLEGNGNDIGLSLSAIGSSSSYDVRVRAVSPGSSADKAGITRGDLISTFDGTSVGHNYDAEYALINKALLASSVRLSGTRKNGSTFTVTLLKTVYKSSPVYKDTILTINGKKIGYLAYARFSIEANSEAILNQLFAGFSSAGVTDLVIDLRYNGGGYVSVAQHFTNLIAPASLNGRLMFKEKFNNLMQSGGATILKNQPLLDAGGNLRYSNGTMLTYANVDYTEAGNTYTFQKTGSLNSIQKVVFIVSGNTASASELMINNLKPYMDVKLVGKTSYGKPVGFFPITIENRYDIYYSMFTSINSAGQTDYFAGFNPDWDATDDITRDFGDPQEICFSAALAYITRGSFAVISRVASVNVKGKSVMATSSSLEVRDMSDNKSFKGMIESRFKFKK